MDAEAETKNADNFGTKDDVKRSDVEKRSQPEASKWLTAHYDPLAGYYTISSCICFADLNGDSDYKLIIADLGQERRSMKLNVYKGTFIATQLTLIGIPSGVISFYMDSGEPSVPAIAVASGSFLYIYKNLKPFYKFSLPSLEINQTEIDAWTQIYEEKIDHETLYDILDSLRLDIGESNLTAKSQNFLDCANIGDRKNYITIYKEHPLRRNTTITCLSTLKKTVSEENNHNCLIIGTENKDIFIIEPDAFTILATIQLASVPVFIEVNGLFNVEYRIIVSCRDAHIYTIKRGFKTGRLCVELNSQPVGLLRSSNNIITATMDQNLSCYTANGNCLWKVVQPVPITSIANVDIEMLGLNLIAVALDNRQVLLYNGKIKVDTIDCSDVVIAMRFGRYGREDNTLVMVTRNGHLIIDILKRTAKFAPQEEQTVGERMTPINKIVVPKKSKIFVDQSIHEREEYLDIHRAFQRDIYRLRLMTARSYVKALTTSMNPVSVNINNPLKLLAQIHGLGPVFRLIIEVQNTSMDRPSRNLYLTFNCDSKIYRIQRNYIPIAFLAPGVVNSFSTKVECINEFNIADFIKVFIVQENESTPLITAVINMPASEKPI